MAEVDEPIDRQVQPFGGAEPGHALLAAVERAAPGAEAGSIAAVEVDERLAAAAREQQARLLEAFANGGDVVVKAAAFEPEAPARFVVIKAGAVRMRKRVGLLDDAAREDPGTAVVIAALGPTGEQHFDAGSAGAHDHQGGRRTRRPVACNARLRGGKRGSVGRNGGHGERARRRSGECGTACSGP